MHEPTNVFYPGGRPTWVEPANLFDVMQRALREAEQSDVRASFDVVDRDFHDRRVTELLAANSAEVEKRRAAEGMARRAFAGLVKANARIAELESRLQAAYVGTLDIANGGSDVPQKAAGTPQHYGAGTPPHIGAGSGPGGVSGGLHRDVHHAT